MRSVKKNLEKEQVVLEKLLKAEEKTADVKNPKVEELSDLTQTQTLFENKLKILTQRKTETLFSILELKQLSNENVTQVVLTKEECEQQKKELEKENTKIDSVVDKLVVV